MIQLNKIIIILQNLKGMIKAYFGGIAEEFRTIMRNRTYISRYPQLFALFSIIEHEQSPHIHETHNVDFDLIKKDILQNSNVSNNHIIEAARSLFQNNHSQQDDNSIKNKIVKYLLEQTIMIIKNDDRYYQPLLRAILRGFPFLLNYNNYELLKTIIRQKSRISYRIIKYILDKEYIYEFFVKNHDAAMLTIYARDAENKPAFMMLMRYLRQHNLLTSLFEKNHREGIRHKTSPTKDLLDYGVVMFSYYEDKLLESHKIKSEIQNFIQEIFSHHLGLKQKQKQESYAEIGLAFTMARRLGYQNILVTDMLEEAGNRFIDRSNKRKSVIIRDFVRSIGKINKLAPATTIRLRSFFAVSPLGPEERWLLRNMPDLL